MNLSNKILAYIKITRPINVVITFCVVVVAIIISQTTQTESLRIILSSITASLTAAAGNIINDVYDIETDKISHPERVLVKGTISKKEALIEYLFLNLIAIVVVSSLSNTLILIVLASILLLFIYSYNLKKLPLVGNFTVAFLTGLAFVYGGFVSGNPLAAIVPAIFAFLINLIREIAKDIQDIEGDSKLGYKTFPIKYGFQKSKKLIILIIIILILFSFFPFINNRFSNKKIRYIVGYFCI
jgi:4-hydroxybenzoate polyprenyltransferase